LAEQRRKATSVLKDPVMQTGTDAADAARTSEETL
jgi:hypothetical protein